MIVQLVIETTAKGACDIVAAIASSFGTRSPLGPKAADSTTPVMHSAIPK